MIVLLKLHLVRFYELVVHFKRKKGVLRVNTTIDWFLRKFDIPHKKYGVWMNGIEFSSFP